MKSIEEQIEVSMIFTIKAPNNKRLAQVLKCLSLDAKQLDLAKDTMFKYEEGMSGYKLQSRSVKVKSCKPSKNK